MSRVRSHSYSIHDLFPLSRFDVHSDDTHDPVSQAHTTSNARRCSATPSLGKETSCLGKRSVKHYYRISLSYGTLLSANYDTAMKFVALVELFIFVRVLLGALTFQNSLLSPIIYAHFLRQRYYQSPFSRDAIIKVSSQVEHIVRRPGNPPMVVTVWEKGQMLVQRWGGVTLAPNTGAPQ